MEYTRRASITFTKERHALQAIMVLWSQQAHNTEYVDFQKEVDLQKKWNFQMFLNCHGSGEKKKDFFSNGNGSHNRILQGLW